MCFDVWDSETVTEKLLLLEFCVSLLWFLEMSAGWREAVLTRGILFLAV